MVPYLSETSARNSWGVTALGRRWMEPARTGSSTWLARIQGLLTTAAPAPSRIHLAQDPGSESEHITRCARAAPQNLQEGVFLGGKSPCLAQHQPRALNSHSSSTELCRFMARWPLLPHHWSKLLQWLWLRGAKPLVATQSSIQADAASHSRRFCLVLVSSTLLLLPIWVS